MVQSVCPKCLWRSKGIQIPSKLPPVQAISLEKTPESNIFDEIYINNESRVDSMSQNKCPAYLCADSDICLLPKYHALLAEMNEDED
ncbi:unnamed protein product [marine sediment metagenome]|uniref:Uncharacterized protein n=1 Tax=marine sediment metagenome TaxID=412755 RepID=X1ECQ5_9ZZZZ